MQVLSIYVLFYRVIISVGIDHLQIDSEVVIDDYITWVQEKGDFYKN